MALYAHRGASYANSAYLLTSISFFAYMFLNYYLQLYEQFFELLGTFLFQKEMFCPVEKWGCSGQGVAVSGFQHLHVFEGYFRVNRQILFSVLHVRMA